jgi:hypothetical protein
MNLDMEYTLAGDALRRPPARHLSAMRARWAHLLHLVRAPDHAPDHLLAWGVTDEVRALAPDQPWPAHAAVVAANSKQTSHQLEHRIGCALAHSALIADEAQLTASIAACPHRWILKHPLGVSGRERVRGDQGALDPRALAWAQRMWASGALLVFEPWVEAAQERSLHYHIHEGGHVDYLGQATLLVDHTGTLRGHVTGPDFADQPPWEPLTRAAIDHIAQLGYFGPISADTMTGLLGGQPVVRPITELNARFTFGRMALALRAHAPRGARLGWHHPTASAPPVEPVSALEPLTPDATPGRYRLPERVDPGGTSGTWVEVG